MVAILAIVGVATAVAQPRAIGAQIGYGIEFSYQHNLGDNFLSVDAGVPGLFNPNVLGVEGVVTYNWLNPFGADFPTISKGDWNWYMGVGGGLGARFHRYHYDGDGVSVSTNKWENHVFVGAAGRVGVEYNFWFPLQLSVEWRPVLGPEFYTNEATGKTAVAFNTPGLFMGGLSLGVRYKF